MYMHKLCFNILKNDLSLCLNFLSIYIYKLFKKKSNLFQKLCIARIYVLFNDLKV